MLVDLRAPVKEKVRKNECLRSEENTDSSVSHQSHHHDLFEPQSATLKSMWWSPTCGHQQISHHCTHYQHASARPYFSWSQTFLLRKIILRLTECPLSNHLSVFIAQTYEKKLTLKLNITENSVKSLNALKKQHLSNTIFRWVGKRMFWL